ncbi:MAG: HAMP domain-containing protein [Planctomycetota bacterium]|jgi:HAMP domain-containing protein
MLRRKLLLVLGSLIVLLLVSALSAILLLHDVLKDLNHASTEVVNCTARTRLLEHAFSGFEADLHRLRGRLGASPQPALTAAALLDERVEGLLEAGIVPEDATGSAGRLRQLQPDLLGHLEAYAGTDDPAVKDEAITLAVEVSAAMRTAIADLSRITYEHSALEHEQVVGKFRRAAIGLGLGFLVLLNASIVVVLRAAIMVLKPLGELAEASRRLGREEFDHRVAVGRTDEFGELAQAYNSMAEQLQANEERKVETLHHVARTLSHELNNAISTIELQLTVVDRRKGDNQALVRPLRQIHQSLGRMSDTIGALKRVQKIVLTDYLSGVKMLDLERSVAEDSPPGQPSTEVTVEIDHP